MNSNNKIVIDLKRHETEGGWNYIWDNFFLKVMPLWFSWLAWVFLMGAFLYFYDQANDMRYYPRMAVNTTPGTLLQLPYRSSSISFCTNLCPVL